MEKSSVPIPSTSPCSSNEMAISPGDCAEGQVEKWLEDEALAGFRVWQLAGIVFLILLIIIVGLCCCIRFRIPRTKQSIEADYIRTRLTKNFRKELSKISNIDIDEMDLRKALERVTTVLAAEGDEFEQNMIDGKTNKPTLSNAFNVMYRGMRTRLTKKSTTVVDII